MLVTREMDYAMRVIRGLDGREHLETAAGIAERENMPQAVTLKILKHLTAVLPQTGLHSSRGLESLPFSLRCQ